MPAGRAGKASDTLQRSRPSTETKGQRPLEARRPTQVALGHGIVITDSLSGTEKLRNSKLLNKRFIRKLGVRTGLASHVGSAAMRERQEQQVPQTGGANAEEEGPRPL